MMDFKEMREARQCAFDTYLASMKARDLIVELQDGRAGDETAWREWAMCELRRTATCAELAIKWLEEVGF